MRPATQGRAYREQRHYCHITIQVTSDEQPKTEKQLKADAAKAKKADAPKAKAPAKKKADAPKAPKKAKAEKVEELETPAEVAAEVEAKGDASVADAKNVETQTTAAVNETQPADEAQQKINEDLERQ